MDFSFILYIINCALLLSFYVVKFRGATQNKTNEAIKHEIRPLPIKLQTVYGLYCVNVDNIFAQCYGLICATKMGTMKCTTHYVPTSIPQHRTAVPEHNPDQNRETFFFH